MSTILIKYFINVLLFLKLVLCDIEFKCPIEAGNGAFADPETCRRFYQCASGVAFKSNCPSGLYFDDVSKLCTYREEARCGPISTTASPTSETPVENIAKRCSRKNCKLPDCFCSRSGTRIPGDIHSSEVPQMILLTFDGAVNLNNYDSYMKIFSKKFQNPNGCEIRGTFFVSHEYSNYQMIEQIALDGHEIAVGTISASKGLENENYDHWLEELVGMKTILQTFANVSKENIIGARAPYLKPGRNIEFEVLFDNQFIYDSSIGAPASEIPFWPYTLDYKIPHKCKSVSCPTKSFPGVWEVPFNMHHVPDDEGGRCPYLDQCVLHNHDANDILKWLQLDFSRHYEKNKAPYMMAFHTNWFALKNLRDGLTKFLEWATQKNDIWFVTYRQMLEWITAPVPLKSIEKSSLWECKNRKSKSTCETSNKCPLKHTLTKGNFSEIRYLETCRSCPDIYPWLGNPKGIVFSATNQTKSNRDKDYDENDDDDDDDDDDDNNGNRERF